jgi:hypothetical protein
MSRFWAAGGSSSESESDDDVSSDESAGKGQNKNRWAEMSDESGKQMKGNMKHEFIESIGYNQP